MPKFRGGKNSLVFQDAIYGYMGPKLIAIALHGLSPTEVNTKFLFHISMLISMHFH